MAFASGWGKSHGLGEHSDTLKHVQVPIVNKRECTTSPNWVWNKHHKGRVEGYVQVIHTKNYLLLISFAFKKPCWTDSPSDTANHVKNCWYFVASLVQSWSNR